MSTGDTHRSEISQRFRRPDDSIQCMEMHGRRVRLPHRHRAVSTHVVVRRAGIPYELERTVCSGCDRVLAERPLRRAAA